MVVNPFYKNVLKCMKLYKQDVCLRCSDSKTWVVQALSSKIYDQLTRSKYLVVTYLAIERCSYSHKCHN